MTENKIECDFRPIKNGGEEARSGRYSQTMHWDVPDFGSSKWVVLGYIDIDWEAHMRDEYLTERDIIERCLAHLNVAPPRKKYQKKEPEPKYGKLEPYKATFKKVKDKPFIIVELITNQFDNPHFWTEGPLLHGVKVKRQKVDPDQADPLDSE